jgi:hypothetical protein
MARLGRRERQQLRQLKKNGAIVLNGVVLEKRENISNQKKSLIRCSGDINPFKIKASSKKWEWKAYLSPRKKVA